MLPKSNTHLRLIVDTLPASDEFKEHLERYIRPLVIKGVPSMVNDLRRIIYRDEAKTKILGDLLQSMSDQMEKSMTLKEGDEEEQDPTV